MLLLSPLGSVKSKLIVLQDCIEWVSKSSCWAVCGCHVSQAPSPWAVIDFGLLNSGLWRLLGGKSLQSVLGSSVTARSRKGQFSLQTQLGPDSAPLQSQGKIPLSRVAPRPCFRTQPLQWDGWRMCLFLSLGLSEISFAVMKLLSSWCGKVETGKRIMSPPELNSDQWPVYICLCPSCYSYLEPSNSSDQIIWLLWAAITFKLNKIQPLKTLMKNIKLRLCFIRYQQCCFNSPPPKVFGVFCAGLCFSSQVAAISSENKLSHERLTHLPLNCFLYDVSPSGPNSIHRSENDSYHIYRKYVSVHKEKGEPQTGLSGL